MLLEMLMLLELLEANPSYLIIKCIIIIPLNTIGYKEIAEQKLIIYRYYTVNINR